MDMLCMKYDEPEPVTMLGLAVFNWFHIMILN